MNMYYCFFSDLIAFKEEFYELIEDEVDAPPKQEQPGETEAADTEKSDEKQKQAELKWEMITMSYNLFERK